MGDKGEVFFIRALSELAKKKNFELSISDDFDDMHQGFDFVFCINYPRLIPKNCIDAVKNGVYVFHSSDLPEGKGWAPLYHSLLSNRKEHVLTTLKINEKIDAGELIVKTYFPKRNGEYTESLREVDNVMTMKTIYAIITDLLSFSLQGKKQKGKGSYYKKRLPEDSEVRPEDTLKKIHAHCLAVGGSYPAFYYLKGKKYIVHIRPESLEPFQEKDIRIEPLYEKRNFA